MQIWRSKLYLLSGTYEGTVEVLVKQSSICPVSWLSAGVVFSFSINILIRELKPAFSHFDAASEDGITLV